ncbi:serine protease Do-like HtrA [Gottschalkia purinilytica]|uniref:Serine protease Do-like HtrA n=1 Tax=Gottschalkia purinilytica TaxID=1503 RepID=A0A0L0W7S3_GOTPU|nr:trypsin-like peptidase domain-containing protein [Gottschalkia purinilytica]KNF07594.1 serine protease Do-like HtrA [Gottschalkia purinilytica]
MDNENKNFFNEDENKNNDVNFQLLNSDNESKEDKTYYRSGNNNYSNNFNNGNNKKRSNLSYVLVSIISAIIGGLIFSLVAPSIYGRTGYNKGGEGLNPQQINITPKDNISTVEAVAKKSMKSVVGITTVETIKEDFFPFASERQVQGVGSGVIVDSNGYILTNSHVVGDGKAENITVLFEDRSKKQAKILWNDVALDLAVIKVDATNLPVADLGDAEKLNIGEIAVAIGNPLGLEFQRTVTSGIISGLNRSITTQGGDKIENLIQTDASINSGNSGGPLLNSKGEVVGINTLKLSSAEGLGFAIPINLAKPIVEQVIKEGKYTSAYIGISSYDVNEVKQRYNLDVNIDKGSYILQIVPNSPAAKSGLQPGDVVVSIDDKKIESQRGLKKLLYSYKPGDKVKIGIVRNGKKIEKNLTLEAAPSNGQ